MSTIVLLTGCVTTAERQAYLSEFSSREVDATVYAKIEGRKNLQVADIEHLVKQQVPEDVILVHLKKEETVYTLRTEDIDGLREAGASEELINFLLNTPELYGHNFPRYYWGRPYHPYSFYPPYFFYDFHGYYHPHRLYYGRP